MNRSLKYSYKNITRIFGLIQVGILFIAAGFYFFNQNSIVKLYAFLVISTIFTLMLSQILCKFTKELYNRKFFKDKIISLSKMLVIMIGLAVFSYNAVKYYKDVPYTINGRYSVIVGECTYNYTNLQRPPHLNVTIGGIEFDMNLKYKNLIKKGEIYKVEYLPNTKEVLSIYDEVLRNN